MARPKKPKSAIMGDDLRIPMTSEQKDVIRQAAAIAGVDMTAWARPILFTEAERVIASKGKKRSAKK
jgi:uncharacterized protein (DUF1778 family)